ncbi:MAG TPA: lysylphosphatidylglycerol synthase domain-containing protein [Solirubrobacteraceae bacterium]|nr:lysylphosphatidylglycerol synthase domain-containing protein [Solirubrobacteraceae bacterium]
MADLLDTFVTGLSAVSVPLLLLAIALHFASECVRNRGWFNILRAALGPGRAPRFRRVLVAYFAGAGLGTVVPARANDLVKLTVLRGGRPGRRFATMLATLVPETIPESVMGALLLAWAVAAGYVTSPVGPGAVPSFLANPLVAAPAIVLAVAALVLLARTVRRRAAGLWAALEAGFAILRSPWGFVRHVAAWQALARPVRIAALVCYLAAFGLTATPLAALVVMAVEGGTRVRVAPAGAALRAAVLAGALPLATGGGTGPEAAAAFSLQLRAVSGMWTFAVSVLVLAALLGTVSPLRILRAVRATRLHARQRQDAIHAAHADRLQDVALGAHELQAPAVAARGCGGAVQLAQARGVDEGEAGEIQDKVA